MIQTYEMSWRYLQCSLIRNSVRRVLSFMWSSQHRLNQILLSLLSIFKIRDFLPYSAQRNKQMNCPSCKTAKLLMSERCGIEIDYCPDCRGIWLDRGELDKLMHSGRAQLSESNENHNTHKYSHKNSKRKSFLEELFD